MVLLSHADNYSSMSDDEIMYQKALAASGIETAISCAQAMAICKMYQFSHVPFREYCDAHNIKFSKCSFGCF